MPATASDFTSGVLDGLLGPSNTTQLANISGKLELFSAGLESVISSLVDSNDQDLRKTALLVVAYLSSPEDRNLDKLQLEKLAIIISEEVIRFEKDKELSTEAAVASLSILSSRQCVDLDEDTLLKLTALTDLQDPWTTSLAASTASKLLSKHLTAQKLTDFIVTTVLQKSLKPLFMKSSTRITALGRPSQYDVLDDRSRIISGAHPCRTHNPWAEATIQWAVETSTTSLIQQHWPLFMPVLLALIESEPTDVKARGLRVLSMFVSKCPAQVLKNTGIGRVFADATFPLLLYLPSVTPENQSTAILIPAYDVLIKLAESTGRIDSIERRNLLDRILRDGIFAGHFHASQHTHIVQVLLQKTATVVNCLGIYSIKHLAPLLSMASSIMTDPFAASYPPALVTATQALETIITNTWPRIRETEHLENVIQMLSLCWLNVSEEMKHGAPRVSGDDVNALPRELVHTARVIQTLWSQDSSKRPAKLSEALKQEPRLLELFPESLV